MDYGGPLSISHVHVVVPVVSSHQKYLSFLWESSRISDIVE